MAGEQRHFSEADLAALLGQARPFRRYPPLEGSDAALLARIGAEGRSTLEATPGVVRVPGQNIDMYALRDFLLLEECAELMRLIDADVKPSTRLSTVSDASYRTSQTCRLSSDHPLVAEIERRFSALLGIPAAYSETVQGQRYQAGEQFKMHNDYFAGGQPYSQAVAKEGGQRTWTAMVFLNRPEAGGCTHFPRAGIKVTPRPGALLAWFNLDREGLPNPFSHHEGMTVESGTKYILTKWFREREWHSSAQSDALRV
jgi:prolyl 4-hydroxylase